MARGDKGSGWGEKVTVKKVGHGGKRTGCGVGKGLAVLGIAGWAYGKNLYDVVTAIV